MPTNFAKLFAGRMHYACVVLAVMIAATIAGVGVRSAPGVMIIPLRHAFGWDVSTISGDISINIILFGATAPFITGLMEVIGLKRTILGCMVVLMAGTGLSTLTGIISIPKNGMGHTQSGGVAGLFRSGPVQ
jgi:hypothetical protein